MPKAEIGSTKYLNNKLKSKGLQRLRWYCQACAKQCRDENGFKMHTQSESHVRQMLLIGESGAAKHINDYSNQFQRDFLQLLRTAHGEKQVHMNHFYQEYISSKEHVHMNATRWPSLTEFAKHLGREGLCRVEDLEKGLHIAWIDNSPENLRRQDAIRKKERQDKGDEEREQALIREQVARAERGAAEKALDDEEEDARMLNREQGEKIKLNFGLKPKENKVPSPPTTASKEESTEKMDEQTNESSAVPIIIPPDAAAAAPPQPPPEKPSSLKMTPNSSSSSNSKPKNVFATSTSGKKKTASKPTSKDPPPPNKRPMSEAERIMREEIERKRVRGPNSNGFASGLNAKRQKTL
ncbi:MAG: hypothetical protein Q9224_006878 [Gallowayella concinna]